jgi:hypothetical protein
MDGLNISDFIRGRFAFKTSLAVPLPAHTSKLNYTVRTLNPHSSVNYFATKNGVPRMLLGPTLILTY